MPPQPRFEVKGARISTGTTWRWLKRLFRRGPRIVSVIHVGPVNEYPLPVEELRRRLDEALEAMKARNC